MALLNIHMGRGPTCQITHDLPGLVGIRENARRFPAHVDPNLPIKSWVNHKDITRRPVQGETILNSDFLKDCLEDWDQIIKILLAPYLAGRDFIKTDMSNSAKFHHALHGVLPKSFLPHATNDFVENHDMTSKILLNFFFMAQLNFGTPQNLETCFDTNNPIKRYFSLLSIYQIGRLNMSIAKHLCLHLPQIMKSFITVARREQLEGLIKIKSQTSTPINRSDNNFILNFIYKNYALPQDFIEETMSKERVVDPLCRKIEEQMANHEQDYINFWHLPDDKKEQFLRPIVDKFCEVFNVSDHPDAKALKIRFLDRREGDNDTPYADYNASSKIITFYKTTCENRPPLHNLVYLVHELRHFLQYILYQDTRHSFNVGHKDTIDFMHSCDKSYYMQPIEGPEVYKGQPNEQDAYTLQARVGKQLQASKIRAKKVEYIPQLFLETIFFVMLALMASSHNNINISLRAFPLSIGLLCAIMNLDNRMSALKRIV